MNPIHCGVLLDMGYSVTPSPGTIAPSLEQTFTFTVQLPSGGTGFNAAALQFIPASSVQLDSLTPQANECFVNLIMPAAWNNNLGRVGLYNDAGTATVPAGNYLDPPTSLTPRSNSQCGVAITNGQFSLTILPGGALQVTIPLTFYAQNSYHLYMSANYYTTNATNPDYHQILARPGNLWVKLCSRLGLREEAVELPTSGVERALLILRAVVDQRATFELDHIANKLVSECFLREGSSLTSRMISPPRSHMLST